MKHKWEYPYLKIIITDDSAKIEYKGEKTDSQFVKNDPFETCYYVFDILQKAKVPYEILSDFCVPFASSHYQKIETEISAEWEDIENRIYEGEKILDELLCEFSQSIVLSESIKIPEVIKIPTAGKQLTLF